MGVCASSHMISRQDEGSMKLPSRTLMVIDMDGCLKEFKQPIQAFEILSLYPQDCFLCSSETMHVDTIASQIHPYEELQLGQLYFLIPISKSHTPFTLQDLCALAIKASTALNNNAGTLQQPKSEMVKFLGRPQACCTTPNGRHGIVGLYSQNALKQSTS